MADKPMVLTKPSVLATMEGRQTQDRRIINPQPIELKPLGPNGIMWPYKKGKAIPDMPGIDVVEPINPRYQVGDRAYVAEGYQILRYSFRRNCVGGKYLADNKEFWTEVTQREYNLIKERKFPLRATSGRFMYRSLARTFMKITEVRAERLQEISEEDAKAEGCGKEFEMNVAEFVHGKNIPEVTYKLGFKHLWNSIHGDGAWGLNPWVWVYRWEELKGE